MNYIFLFFFVVTAFGTAAASKACEYWLYFMGRRPQDSFEWASGRLTPRLSRRQPRIRATVKEIVENRRIATVPPASVAPDGEEVKKRARNSALLKMALLPPIPTNQHVETAASTQRLKTIVVQEFKYPLMTVSDDENDLAAVEEYYYRAGFDYQPAWPTPGG